MKKVAVISKEELNLGEEAKNKLRLALLNLAKDSELWVITPLNRGAETEAAILALSSENISLECAIPFEEQARCWSEAERDRYFDIIEKSDKETLITTKWQQKSELYTYTYLVNSADIILIGTPSSDEISTLINSSGKKVIQI